MSVKQELWQKDFLCLYGLTKVGMISIVEERTMPQTINVSVHHVQEVINVTESQLKTRLILYSPDLNHAGEGFSIQKAKNIMKQNDHHNCAITRK